MSQHQKPAKPVLIHPTAGERGMTELHHAAYRNDPEAVAAQLRLGVPVDVRDDAGWTPLLWSVDMAEAWGDPNRVVSLLLGAGASANAVANSGLTVLMMACARNNIQILRDLLNSGADIHLRSTESSPLHQAAGCNFTDAIRVLLSLGADPSQRDANGQTPEEVARECGFDECASVFPAGRRG
jgi:26S proteasome non-ATPase regulatory subunit 10